QSHEGASLAAAYVLHRNLLVRCGLTVEADALDARMKALGIQHHKMPGVSTAMVMLKSGKGEVLIKCIAGDKLTAAEAAEQVRCLAVLREMGYKADHSAITRSDLSSKSGASDADRDDHLCGHSERVCLMKAHVLEPDAGEIRISKNLRVCMDCHQYTALMS